ncbi:unnamed protein product [Hermetia illucens]|uniref:Uncharacterized protein n=1 Tax=Hermetia illucens TaxID=343691 RepID=A0A7R8UUH7_HERIL|nr:uncharacterized protein LOC119654807 [Hermetia illucens]CAD7087222.1 unnamed protein product [Hermetia illucens]
MKLFIVLCAVIAMATAYTKEDFLKDREECLKSEKVPEAVIEKLKNRQYDGDLGHEAQCYIRCLAVKIGSFDDATGYDLDKTYSHLTSAGLVVTKENLKKCISAAPADGDKCAWAAKDLKCLWTNKYISKKQ